jgi:LPS-assembly lipoprotein
MRARFAAILAMAMLGGCGFQPLYAVKDGAEPGLSRVALASLEAPEAMRAIIARAYARRAPGDSSAAEYDLVLAAREVAERLAVQSDASVTRYNYRLVGDYSAVERASGRKFEGSVQAIASFNVVNSQYSTLFAEQAAKEKAATQLINDIERALLLQIDAAQNDK